MTTKDALKVLPINEELKLKILRTFDYMSPAQRLTIARLTWKLYDFVRTSRVDYSIEEQLAKALEGKEEIPLDKKFFGKVLEKVDQEMTGEVSEASKTVDLEEARAAMRKIVQEMNEVKIAKKLQQQKKIPAKN